MESPQAMAKYGSGISCDPLLDIWMRKALNRLGTSSVHVTFAKANMATGEL